MAANWPNMVTFDEESNDAEAFAHRVIGLVIYAASFTIACQICSNAHGLLVAGATCAYLRGI